ncbi:MAG: ATP synthase F0 subunit B [Acidobacteriota bacterium]
MFDTNLFTQLPALPLVVFYWAEGLNPLIPKTVNLLLFIAVLVYLLRKPFLTAMQNRRDSIKAELKRAQAEKAEALEKLQKVEARLARLDQEVIEIRNAAEREAKAEYDRMIKQAQEEAERLKQMATREIESSVKAAQMELRSFAAAKSVELAETMIRQELKPADNARLITDFAKELEEVK